MDNVLSQNVPHSKYTCTKCDYSTSNKKDYAKHKLTRKHQRITKDNDLSQSDYVCNCGKTYKYKSGLCKHRRSCTHVLSGPPSSNNVDASLVLELLKQNTEFKQMMMEQNKHILDQNEKITELAKNAGNVTNNNTTNNTTNKFNLNFFLNETCKDAISMNDFINSIEVSMDDFVRTGNIGFVDGISKVMVERIKDMEMHTRPLHCTDLKRETMYIKNEERWEKEDTDKTQLRNAVKNVANKNYKQLQKWYDRSKPAVEQIGSEECEDYFKYYKASLGGYDKEEDNKFEEKIIRNVLKEVVVDKA